MLALCWGHVNGVADEKSSARTASIEVVIAEYTTPGKADPVAGLGASDKSAAERLKQLATQGQLGVVTQVQLSSLSEQEASLQVGETVPVATGRTFGGGRGGGAGGAGGGGAGGGFPVVTNYTMVNVGTLIRVTPEIETDGSVLVDLAVERSRLATKPKPEGAAEGEPTRTVSVTAKSTVRAPPGQTVLVSGARTFGNGETTELLIIVSAKAADAAPPQAAQATKVNNP